MTNLFNAIAVEYYYAMQVRAGNRSSRKQFARMTWVKNVALHGIMPD
jgi:hypothetical protein